MSTNNRRSGRDSGPRGSGTVKAAEKFTGGVGCSSSPIPSGSRIIVQNLKEIVNNPENEIYAMLKECNMDPSETINRLLNQDNFQEVKSKRDKKKEVKDTSDSKARGLSNTMNRGGRAANDRTSRVGPVGLTNTSYNDYGVNRSKPIPKKENVPFTGSNSSILGSAFGGNTVDRVSSLSANSTDTSAHVVSTTDDVSLKQSGEVQHVWQRIPGQVSMADVVRMGSRSHAKVSGKTPNTSAVLPSAYFQEWQSFPDLPSNPEVSQNPNATTIDSYLPHDGQSFVKQLPIENTSSMFVMSSSSAVLVEPSGASSLHDDGHNSCHGSHVNDNQLTNINFSRESLVTGSVISDTSGDGQVEHFDSGSRLILDDASLKNVSSNSQVHTFDHHEAENANPELSAFTGNLEQLSIQNEVVDVNTAEENPAVVFPDHLQVTNTDCSHLSFGSFGSVLSAGFPGSNAHNNNNLKSSLESTSTTTFHHVDSRIPDFYNEDHPKSNSDENAAASLAISDTENYDQPTSSQITGVSTDITHPANEIQYNIPSLTPRDTLSSDPQSSTPEQNYIDTNSQVSSISSMMQAYANSLQGNLISSTTQPARQFDPPYLPLLANETMPTKYSSGGPLINEPTISLPESSFFSVPQAPQQSSPSMDSGSIPTGPSVPQHMSVHPYSQSGLSMSHFANMIGYPFLHPSYAYMPQAAFPPTYTGNAAYHQSQMAAQNASTKYTLPQYKSNASLNSLQQQSTSVPSGYGGFGSSSNIPGSFVLNPLSAPSNATTSFDGALGSQYKDDNAYATSLHQHQNMNSWLQGAGSRTVSALPANTYYNMQQQGQGQHSGLRQAQQQQPSHYGAASGYPNFYRSQVGSQEQQQMQNDALNMNSSQGVVPSQSSHHWQRNY